MPNLTLVTGPTGNVGREVVGELERRGAAFRLGLSRPSAVPSSVLLDFHRPDTFRPAVQGCTSVFLLRPPPISDTRRTLNVFIDAARDAGVQQIVFLSVAGAEGKRFVPHHAVEHHLKCGPDGWTILRPGFFAQNLASAYLDDIVTDHRLYVPAGNGRVAFVDLRDVAVVAVDALLAPDEHRAGAYTLTGPSAFTFEDVAGVLTRTTGHSIRYEPASVLGYLRHLRRAGLSRGQCLVQTVLHVGLRSGQAEAVDPTLGGLLGRRPMDVAQYIRDHAELWM